MPEIYLCQSLTHIPFIHGLQTHSHTSKYTFTHTHTQLRNVSRVSTRECVYICWMVIHFRFDFDELELLWTSTIVPLAPHPPSSVAAYLPVWRILEHLDVCGWVYVFAHSCGAVDARVIRTRCILAHDDCGWTMQVNVFSRVTTSTRELNYNISCFGPCCYSTIYTNTRFSLGR